MTARLAAMMFLQFFALGAWYVTVGNYMAANEMEAVIHWAYTVNSMAALVSPFLLGLVVDRYFATERVLGVLGLLGGASMLAAALVPPGASAWFIGLLLVHALCFVPTLSLGSTLAFHHLPDQARQFPVIRAFGSIGWIAAGVLVSGILRADQTAIPLFCAAGAALAFGFYGFTLPHTPPPNRQATGGVRSVIDLKVFRRLATRPFVVFAVCLVLVFLSYPAYHAYTPVFITTAGLSQPGFKMALGQASETVLMFGLPFFLARYRFKVIFALGIAAWVLRWGFLGMAALVPGTRLIAIVLAILLHGFCFNFIYVAGQLYVDRVAGPGIRGQAQGLLVFFTMGLGQFFGAQLSGLLFNRLVGDAFGEPAAWPVFWLVQMGVCLAVLLAFIALFRPGAQPAAAAD